MNLEAAITSALSTKEKPFAIFDFDNTCIQHDVGEATLHYVCRNKLLKDNTLVEHAEDADYHEAVFHEYHRLLESGDTKGAYVLYAKMFSGFTVEEAEATTRAAIDAEGNEIGTIELYGRMIAHGLAPRPQVLELMRFLKSNGVRVWIISASLEVTVKTAMVHFGIESDGLIGVRTKIRDDRMTAELDEPVPIIEGKVTCLRTYIHPSASPLVVVDDSLTGLPILETADIKVAIDGRMVLANEARKRGWYLI